MKLMNKKLVSFATLLACSFLAQASEFWLQPLKFVHRPGEDLVVNFKVGEGFVGEPWTVKKDRLERLELHQKNTLKDLKGQVVEGDKDNLKTPLTAEGTYLLAMQSTNASSEMEAEKFNAYLKDNGLDEAYGQRRKTNTMAKNGTELYARYSKLLVQAGEKTDATFRKEVGFPVEIVPEQNPYTLKVGDPVKFRILYMGKPVFGAKVKVLNFNNNRTTAQNIFSQQDGTIETHISNPGRWMVSFVKMVPSKDPKADWQSYWATLVFGIK
ncbi:DUF4198 domain-containing protein [Fulvivirgaceae bacterium PWU4]|uniref:DUF4198 domain-containing protein n=1 Tax=Chryseosolibacter histidini TaxID=2782349 RepID=A0AAP2GL26_9BACT|nr:DUF4198 domain-containing protein [Chryseosolibacter histidini]MBT1699951.1 DUF4198 domain-containing protein [Chryseosolibacter histidini]